MIESRLCLLEYNDQNYPKFKLKLQSFESYSKVTKFKANIYNFTTNKKTQVFWTVCFGKVLNGYSK